MDRREFAALLPALLAGSSLVTEGLEAQSSSLPVIESGVYKPSPMKAGSMAGHSSGRYLSGMLKAGNIRLEMHESTIEPGAEHEAVGTHLHSEIWLVREGTAGVDDQWRGEGRWSRGMWGSAARGINTSSRILAISR